MPDQAETLRLQTRDLFDRRARGDLPEREYQRRVTESSIELCRVLGKARLASDEEILAELHLVHSHFKLNQSLLDEPEQLAASFFATNRRLIRVRNVILPTRPVSYDEFDQTVVDELSYADMGSATMRKRVRLSEALTGLVVAALALLLGNILAVTGPLLLLFGVAGILHALLFPTRCFVITPRAPRDGAPFEIYGVRRRGARNIIRIVRNAIRARGAGDPRVDICPSIASPREP